MFEARIQQHFIDSADLKYQVAESLAKPVAEAVVAVVACLTNGGKWLAGGAGPASTLTQALVRHWVDGFERSRPGLAALALDDVAEADGWTRQIEALGLAGDGLLLVSASPPRQALLQAVTTAHRRDMVVIALSAHAGRELADALLETDVHIQVPHARLPRVLEIQQLLLHALCDGVDCQLLGEPPEDLS